MVVAPEVAAQLVQAHTSGADLAALAGRWHLTPREVARVVAVRHPRTGMPVPPAATQPRVLP